jgi:acetylornithine deacetylase/succinyl-diaminopimelate desuccinylase-like protein
MSNIKDTDFKKVTQDLKELVKFKSLSNFNHEDYNFDELVKCANCIKEKFEKENFDVKLLQVEKEQPYVFAKKIVDDKKPTVLFYAHYDIQPVEIDKWNTSPYELIEKDNRLFARGSSDDKAGIVAVLAVIRYFNELNQFPVNIKVLIEGEEEYGSNHIEKLLKTHKKEFEANCVIVLDGTSVKTTIGTLGFSNRGNVNLKLTIDALENPVHSGLGCLCPDVAQAISHIICSLKNPEKIEGMLNGICKLTNEERSLLKKSSISFDDYANEMKVLNGKKSLRIDEDKTVFENIFEKPVINVVNLIVGQKEGGNSLQSSAECTLNIRVPAGQDPKNVLKAITKHLEKQNVLYNLKLNIEVLSVDEPFKANLDGEYTKKFFEAMKKKFKTTSIMPSGGTIPLLKLFEDIFDMQVIVYGIEDPLTYAHSHNESQDIELLRKTIDSLIDFLKIV